MKNLLDKIIALEAFSEEEAKQLIYSIDEESINSETLAGILTGFQIKGLELSELIGFKNALLELSNPLSLDADNAIDLCGTGGDGKNTFNISTTSALVIAAMGHKVIKHGNYGVSSISGSSNVLEEVGFTFSPNESDLAHDLASKNICFIHAPLFHPTLKKAASTRKNLGVRTIFNCLGPLVNPAQPAFQLTGTYSIELAKSYQHILKPIRNNYRVVYGMDGYDEITLTDATRVLGKYTDELIDGKNFRVPKIQQNELFGGTTVKDAAKILMNILQGKGSDAQNNAVSANVAMGLSMFHPNETIDNLFTESVAFIQSGQAYKHHFN